MRSSRPVWLTACTFEVVVVPLSSLGVVGWVVGVTWRRTEAPRFVNKRPSVRLPAWPKPGTRYVPSVCSQSLLVCCPLCACLCMCTLLGSLGCVGSRRVLCPCFFWGCGAWVWAGVGCMGVGRSGVHGWGAWVERLEHPWFWFGKLDWFGLVWIGLVWQFSQRVFCTCFVVLWVLQAELREARRIALKEQRAQEAAKAAQARLERQRATMEVGSTWWTANSFQCCATLGFLRLSHFLGCLTLWFPATCGSSAPA